MAFKFNDVLVPFKAQVNDFIVGMKLMKDSLVTFARDVDRFNQEASRTLNGPLDKNGNAMKALDFRTLRAIDRLALLVVMSRNVKAALDSLFTATSGVSIAFAAVAEGFMTFSSLSMFMKDNLGLVAAGLAGVTAAVILFLAQINEAQIKATNLITEGTLKSQARLAEFTNKVSDARKVGALFNDTYGEAAKEALSINRSALEESLQQERKLELAKTAAADKVRQIVGDAARVNEVMENLAFFNPNLWGADVGKSLNAKGLKNAQDELATVDSELARIKQRVQDITGNASILKLAEHFGQLSTELRTLQDGLKDFQNRAPALQKVADLLGPKAGFFTNLSEDMKINNARELLSIREKILTTMLEEVEAARKLLEIVQSKLDLDPANNELQAEQKRLQDLINARNGGVPAATSALLDAQTALNDAKAGREFTDAFTKPLTNAISTAVVDGIVNGKKGAEILADLTKNLLTNALNDVFKHLQTGLIDVFKSIAGAGGEILGSALTAVVGIVAGVVSKKKGGSDQFDQIKNQIESTQAVRGIVAGPTNVAIATVGESIKRANAGIEGRLDVVIQVLTDIRNSGQSTLAGSVTVP